MVRILVGGQLSKTILGIVIGVKSDEIGSAFACAEGGDKLLALPLILNIRVLVYENYLRLILGQHFFDAPFHDSKVLLVDGEMFSWYGSRMVKAKAYFDELMELHNSRPE